MAISHGDQKTALATHRHVKTVGTSQMAKLPARRFFKRFVAVSLVARHHRELVAPDGGQENHIKLLALERVHGAHAQPLAAFGSGGVRWMNSPAFLVTRGYA